MFLDDELVQIYGKWGGADISNKEDAKRCLSELMVACLKRYMPENPQNITQKEFAEMPVKIKQIDNSWKAFCWKVPTDRFGIVDSRGFRIYLWKLNNSGDQPISKQLFKMLGWEEPIE